MKSFHSCTDICGCPRDRFDSHNLPDHRSFPSLRCPREAAGIAYHSSQQSSHLLPPRWVVAPGHHLNFVRWPMRLRALSLFTHTFGLRWNLSFRRMKLHNAERNTTPCVVTGMGLATSLGCDVKSTWAAIRRGNIVQGPMTDIESPLPDGALCGQAMELPSTYAQDLPREARYLRWVIEQALSNAGAGGTAHKPRRCAIVLGTTLHGIRAGGRFLRSDDPSELRNFLANAIMRHAIRGLGIQGVSLTTCSACSSSLGAIALGLTILESREADLVIAGGYDAISEYVWAGFNALRLVAPSEVRPFAANREGMMPSEGYGVVTLERSVDARARGATVLVTIEGWGESADAHHLTQPDPTGSGATKAIRDALSRAGLQPRDISMIAAHGTATTNNDASEYAGFHTVFGESLPSTPVVGFKSYLGHSLGAAGAVELILSACALRAGWVPPCAAVHPLDGEFTGLTVAPPGGLDTPITRTLNTSLGFGGANTCLILGRPDDAPSELINVPQQNPCSRREAWITGYGVLLPSITGISALLERLAGAPGSIIPPDGASVVNDEQLSQTLNVRRMRRLSTCVKLMLGSVSLAIRHAGGVYAASDPLGYPGPTCHSPRAPASQDTWPQHASEATAGDPPLRAAVSRRRSSTITLTVVAVSVPGR